jgi:hypothetical protein
MSCKALMTGGVTLSLLFGLGLARTQAQDAPPQPPPPARLGPPGQGPRGAGNPGQLFRAQPFPNGPGMPGQPFQTQRFPMHYQAVAWLSVGPMGVVADRVDDVLRAQLGLKPGEGIVVREVMENSPAAKAGIKPLDVMTALGGKPIESLEGAIKALHAAGSEPVDVDLIRQGKPMKVQVKGVKEDRVARVFDSESAPGMQSEYWIGIPVTPVDETLRSHLDLPEGQGLVVVSVQPESPADRAGLKANDLLLTMGGKPLGNPADLVRQIQDAGAKAQTLALIRGGKRIEVEIIPEKRGRMALRAPDQGAPNSDQRFRIIRPGFMMNEHQASPFFTPPEMRWSAHQMQPTPFGPGSDHGMKDVIDEIKSLRKAIEELRKSLDKE